MKWSGAVSLGIAAGGAILVCCVSGCASFGHTLGQSLGDSFGAHLEEATRIVSTRLTDLVYSYAPPAPADGSDSVWWAAALTNLIVVGHRYLFHREDHNGRKKLPLKRP